VLEVRIKLLDEVFEALLEVTGVDEETLELLLMGRSPALLALMLPTQALKLTIPLAGAAAMISPVPLRTVWLSRTRKILTAPVAVP